MADTTSALSEAGPQHYGTTILFTLGECAILDSAGFARSAHSTFPICAERSGRYC